MLTRNKLAYKPIEETVPQALRDNEVRAKKYVYYNPHDDKCPLSWIHILSI